MKKSGKSKKLGNFPSISNYLKGNTILNSTQIEMLQRISTKLNYYSDNYNNLHSNYAPEGIISFLRDQVIAKIQNGGINSQESEEAIVLINEFESNLKQFNE
ncbi:hypothetical protein EHS13_35680 [Paenibacillus psychroresistens]|uniref:Uncharacterized protein n=1 Tax=Paenibacillus psychroresistens TaxID=1778678 RepID=A0A6B8RVP0_9BACL|nr:hypothetical protein [Paenibacillus psychroresistens]QGQ99829.1 hypothetical protein EHS13_35680 [Paenibacillus psychroresistens]